MYSSNYINKPSFGANTSNPTFGASTSTFGQPAANTPMFSSMQPSNIFQNPNTSSFSAAASNPTGFGEAIVVDECMSCSSIVDSKPEPYPFFMPLFQNTSFGFRQPADLSIRTAGFQRTSSPVQPPQIKPYSFASVRRSDPNLLRVDNTLSPFLFGSSGDNRFRSNLFGQQQQPSTSGLFGSSNAFGQSKPAFGFGSTPAQTGLFGQQQTQQPTGTSLFQSNTPNLFGSTNAFGSQGQTQGTVIKFSPVTGTDTMQKNGVATSISTKHHCITCMKEYENKSLEELRFEDYSCNRKGPTQQPGFATAPFGAPAPTGATPLFGQTENKTSFGATPSFGQTSTFGQATPGFGLTSQSNAPSLFGKPSGFGATTSNTNTFSFNTAQTASNPFSASQAPKPFAAPLFGTATTQSQPTFGGGVFGQTNPQVQNTTTNLFQKPAQPTTGFNTGQTMFSFNQNQTTQAPNLFNVSKPTTGFGIFGTTNTGTSTFGQPNTLATNFGKPATTTFGQPATQPTFGLTLGGGLGQTQQQPLFGNTAPKPTSLFGTATTGSNLFSTNVFQQPAQPTFSLGNVTQQQPAQFPSENANDTKFMSMLATDSFPDGPHVYGLEPVMADAGRSTTNPQDLKSLLDISKKREELSGTRSKIQVQLPKPKRGSHYSKEFFETNQALKSSHKCLVIRKFNDSSNTIYNKYKNELIEEAEECLKSTNENDSIHNSSTPNNHSEKNSPNMKDVFDRDFYKPKKVGLRLQFDTTIAEETEENKSMKTSYTLDDSVTFSPIVASTKAKIGISEDDFPPETPSDSPVKNNASIIETENTDNAAGVVLTKPEYYMYPSIKDLQQYIDENGRCVVQGLTLGRKGYGNVHYSDPIDITNMNLDEIVHFRHREIIVYPDDDKKPPIGEGLNRPAQVTLDKIYPREKGTNKYITDVTQIIQSSFVDNLMNITQKHNCKFVDYRPKTGSWVFKVKHFSKYGFTDSDEEECEVMGEKIAILRKQGEAPGKKIEEVEEIPMGLGGTLVAPIDKSQNIIEVETLGDDQITHQPYDLTMFLRENIFMTESSIQTIKSSLFTNLDKAPIFDDGTNVEQEKPVEVVKSEVLSSPKIYRIPDMSYDATLPHFTSAQRCYTEMGIFRNNTFKVGWGKGCNFYNISMTVENEFVYGLTSNHIQDFDQGLYSDMMPALTDMLKITLEESDFTLDSNNIPTFAIKEDLGFLQKQTMLFNDHVRLHSLGGKERYLSSVWNLCTALWGRGDDSTYSRRQYFSDWLKRFSYDLADEFDLSSHKNYDKTRAFEKVFQLLSFHKVAEACEFASENNLSQISLVISQLCANERVKVWMKKYVDCFAWKEKGIIPDEFKKLYLLLSGIPVDGAINICEDLDWMRCLGLHLWYVAPAAAPIDVAVNLYKKAFEDSEYAVRPNPPYCGQFGESETFDLLYHILSLYTESTYQLCYVLHPASHTENLMDYRLSWHLLQLFLSLKVGLICNAELDQLHTTFSNQLESMGHWKYAIFVLLFLEENIAKKNLVMKILDRHLEVGLETLETEKDLVKTFKVPAKWIHEVKAIKAKLCSNYYEYFQHCVHMENWQEANDAFVEHILPELFINEQYEDLLKFINKLEPVADSLQNWNTQGGLFKDFLEMDDMLRHSDESLRFAGGKLQSLCRRVACFPVENDKQKLCVAELSRKCALLFKILNKKTDCNVFQAKFVDIINTLVMPPDYKHFEIFYLISKFVNGDNIVH